MPESGPSVLFVCVHNAVRSQMAAAFLTPLSEDRTEVRSAGPAPADTVNPAAVRGILAVRPTRDAIERRVRGPLAELLGPAESGSTRHR